MTEVLVPHPDPIQAGVWKYLEDVNQPAVYGCAKQVYGGALLDGGFDDQAGAAGACGTATGCAPTTLTVPFVGVNDFVELYYRVDYGDEIGTVEMYQIEALETNARSVLSGLFVDSVGGLVDLVVGSGGGIASFQYLQSDGEVVGGDASAEIDGANPTTINLLTFADAGASGDYDFVADVFGVSVSVHSCGAQNWPEV